MVRFATAQLRAGHLPLTSWFPYLGLGSPQFLHYQSLPAIITGALGLAIGPDTAFRWTLYLLLSLWPVSVYLGARLLGASRVAAAAAAAMSPFLWSTTGIGYEQHAYLWTGFGVWTQLWASTTLPLAWGLGWRAIRDGRHILAAVTATALTVALHFETGYLALVPLVLWPLVCGGPLVRRFVRAGAVLAGSLLAAAWVIVPLVTQRDWAAQNEVLRGTPLANGYGAGRVLRWLCSGQLLDHGRLPVVTLFAALGLILAVRGWRRDTDARALLVVLIACLLLSFGRATFGDLVDVIPGSGDIFFRRFAMGVQLAALMLAGLGAAWAAQTIWRGARTAALRRGLGRVHALTGRSSTAALTGLAAAVLVLAPAWLELGRYDSANARAVAAQRDADATQGAELDRLLTLVRDDGGGRVYAGEPTNWGATFTVGAVPVFKYLESEDIDEVGYTLRTASLMTDPEYYFDDTNLGDYKLFGIRYLLVPTGYLPPVRAKLAARAGPYTLWTLEADGYVHTATIVGVLAADRTDIGERSIPLLHSRLAERDDDLEVSYRPGRPLPLPRAAGSASGTVLGQPAHLAAGEVQATVRMDRAGVVVLSASYDPGWTASVDGRPQRTLMVAPALVATRVPAGTHRIVFRYRGYSNYPLLFAISAATLILIAIGIRRTVQVLRL
jgi:hypothetical protein